MIQFAVLGEVKTKADEKELLGHLIDALPDGYLRGILTNEREAIEHAIDLDVCCLDLRAVIERRAELDDQFRSIQGQIESARRALTEIEKKHQRAADLLSDLRSEAHRILSIE